MLPQQGCAHSLGTANNSRCCRPVCPAVPQKCALQAGVPIEASARLAQHTVEEAKRYSTNCTYELCDTTAAALKLVSSPCAHRLLCRSARNPLSPRRNSCAVLPWLTLLLLLHVRARRRAQSGGLPTTRCRCRWALEAASIGCRNTTSCLRQEPQQSAQHSPLQQPQQQWREHQQPGLLRC